LSKRQSEAINQEWLQRVDNTRIEIYASVTDREQR